MKTGIFTVSFLAVMLLAAPAFSQQITRTDWQMHEGQDVIILAKKLSGSGPAEVFAQAAVPAEKDKGWKPAPDGKIIAFGGPSASKLPKDKCNQAVDYTYFQTFVDVPANAKVTEFKITFDGMDDASRITIFNKANPSGTIVSGSYVKRGERGTTDLHSLITAGPNRIVVTQVDSCAIGNQLAKAEVVLNGKTITPAVVKPGPFIPIAHGDVHIRSSDGVNYDFQAAGDYLYFQSTDKDIMVQARQEMWDKNPKVSVIRAGAMRVGKDTVELYALPTATLLINGKETPIPTTKLNLPGGGTIAPSKNAGALTLLITWPGESFVARMLVYPSNNTMDVQIRRDLPQARTTEGLIGSLDGDRSNDFRLRDGTKLSSPPSNDTIARLGESWQVRPAESLFKRARATNATGVVKQQPGVADLDPNARVAARDTCAKAGINDPLALRSCVYDVAATGDKSFVESAKQVQTAVAALPKADRAAETPESAAIQAPASSASSTLFLLGEKLGRGNRYSMEGHYVIFQQDGNLCVYTKSDQFVWCINNDPKVNYKAAAVVELTKQGQLVMRDAQGAVLWAAPATPRPGARVVLSPRGALELRDGANTLLWTSKP